MSGILQVRNAVPEERYSGTERAILSQARKTSKRYKEYDGTYLGYYSQWFFFFTLGIFMFIGIIFTMVGKLRNWF